MSSYEYAVQIRRKGEGNDCWKSMNNRSFDLTLHEARQRRAELAPLFPNSEMRIIRRPLVLWQVVEEVCDHCGASIPEATGAEVMRFINERVAYPTMYLCNNCCEKLLTTPQKPQQSMEGGAE